MVVLKKRMFYLTLTIKKKVDFTLVRLESNIVFYN